MSKYDGFGETLGLEKVLGTAYGLERSFANLGQALVPSHVRALIDMQDNFRPLEVERSARSYLEGIETNVADQHLNAVDAAYEMKRSSESLHAVMVPAHVRALMDMQKSLRAFDLDRAALGHLDGVERSFAQYDLVTTSCQAVSQIMRERSLVSMPWVSIEDGLTSLLGRQAWSASSTFRLAESLDGVLPKPLRLEWQEHLVKSMVPSFDLLAASSRAPLGLLSFMHEPELGASLAWRNERTCRPSVAALVPEVPRLRKVAIETVVVCAFCGETLVIHEQQLRWKGNVLRRDVSVIPICGTCGERARDDGNYIADSLDRLLQLQPALRLVAWSGKSDGVPRGKGKLRLVTSDECDGGDAATDRDEDGFE